MLLKQSSGRGIRRLGRERKKRRKRSREEEHLAFPKLYSRPSAV